MNKDKIFGKLPDSNPNSEVAEFRSKIDVRNAGEEQLVKVGFDGTIYMEYPMAIQGQLFDIRLERLNILLNLDYKQLFNDVPLVDSQGRIEKAKGYFKHADTSVVPSNSQWSEDVSIANNVQDLRSLVHTHQLRVVVGYEESIDYRTYVKWTKWVTFEGNTPDIIQWLKAIGLMKDDFYKENKYYKKGDVISIPSQDILIGPDAVIDIVMEANDADFNMYGDSASNLVLAQVIADRPIHSIIAYNANDASTYFRSMLLGDSFTFKFYHHWLNRSMNKLTLDKSIISIEIRGKIVK